MQDIGKRLCLYARKNYRVMANAARSIAARTAALVLFVVLSLYSIGIGFYVNASTQALERAIDTNVQQMEHYLKEIEDGFLRVISLLSSGINSPNTQVIANRYSDMSDYDWGVAINTHINDMKIICQSNRYVVSAATYYHTLGKAVGYPLGLLSIGSASEVAPQNTVMSIYTKSGLVYDANRLCIVLPLRVSGNRVIYTNIVVLSSALLRDDLFRFNSESDSYSALSLKGELIVETRRLEDMLLSRETLNWNTGVREVNLNDEQWFLYTIASPSLNIVLQHMHKTSDLSYATDGYRFLFIVLTVSAVAFIVISFIYLHRGMHHPLHELIDIFEQLNSDFAHISIPTNYTTEFGYVFCKLDDTVQKLRQYIEKSYAQNMLLQRAELLQLQSQINPHFLYNSYFLLHRMVQSSDYTNAMHLSKYMGEYFKYITRNAQQAVALTEEVNHARTYANIQAMRFRDRIDIRFDEPPPGISGTFVPRLILQPIIENAFEHGLKEKIGGGIVQVTFEERAECIAVIIEDNGDDLSEDTISRITMALEQSDDLPIATATALVNIHRRLTILYRRAGITVSRSTLGGLCVSLHIPKEGYCD